MFSKGWVKGVGECRKLLKQRAHLLLWHSSPNRDVFQCTICLINMMLIQKRTHDVCNKRYTTNTLPFFSFWSCINYIFQNVFVQGVFNKRWQTSSDLWSLVIVFTKLSFLPSKISLFGHTLVAFVSQSNHTTTSHLPKTNTMHAKAGLSSEVDARPFNAIVWPQNDS